MTSSRMSDVSVRHVFPGALSRSPHLRLRDASSSRRCLLPSGLKRSVATAAAVAAGSEVMPLSTRAAHAGASSSSRKKPSTRVFLPDPGLSAECFFA
ncbi:hypothetical protein Aduo_011049 [Ancylostoma duodenale]